MRRLGFFVPSVLFFVAPAGHAQVVPFEGDAYPDSQGWTRVQVYALAERWLDGGWFVQYTEYVHDPDAPREDWYRRSLADFSGAPSFFVEWRMQSNGDRSAIPSGAPAGLTASGTMGIGYHFTLARDQARLIDPYLNVVLFEIAPDVPHVYRLDVRGMDWTVHIDGALVNSGTATRTYPTSDSVIQFGARAPLVPATTRWDYIRYGVIPDDAGPGDLNCDGTLNQFDIDPFIAALVSADGYGQQHPACNRLLADANLDGSVNQFDILPFVDLLLP